MMSLRIDQEDFTRIFANNPSLVLGALRYLAYQWAGGCPNINELDCNQIHGWFVAEQLGTAGSDDISHGAQHIPAFLRELASRMEAGQVQHVKDLVAKFPNIVQGLGEVYQGWIANGFPQLAPFGKPADVLSMIDQWEAEGRPMDPQKYGWMADPSAPLKFVGTMKFED